MWKHNKWQENTISFETQTLDLRLWKETDLADGLVGLPNLRLWYDLSCYVRICATRPQGRCQNNQCLIELKQHAPSGRSASTAEVVTAKSAEASKVSHYEETEHRVVTLIASKLDNGSEPDFKITLGALDTKPCHHCWQKLHHRWIYVYVSEQSVFLIFPH